MLDFLAQNIGTIVVALLLSCIVAAIIVASVRNKKRGGGCSGGCSGCPFGEKCHKQNDTEKREENNNRVKNS